MGLYDLGMTSVVKRILAPVDLAESREPDLDYAIGLASQLGAELMLLVVVDTPATLNLIGHHGSTGRGGGFEHELQEEVQAKLQRAVDQATKAGVKALGHLTYSEEVEEQILKEALLERVDLILVRSQGRSGIMKALLGSTAGEILKAAPCPVLVARS